MSVQEALAGFEMLSKGASDYRERKDKVELDRRSQAELARVMKANEELGTELLSDPMVASDQGASTAAKMLSRNLIGAEKAMGAFGKLSPEEAVLFLNQKAFMGKDPKMQEAASIAIETYANRMRQISRAKAQGEMEGSIAGGALLLKGKGSGGGGGGGGSSDGDATYTEVYSSFTPANYIGGLDLNSAEWQTFLKDRNGNPIKIDMNKSIAKQVQPKMKPDDYAVFQNTLEWRIGQEFQKDPTLGNIPNPNYLERQKISALNNILNNGKPGLYNNPKYDDKGRVVNVGDPIQIRVGIEARDYTAAQILQKPASFNKLAELNADEIFQRTLLPQNDKNYISQQDALDFAKYIKSLKSVRKVKLSQKTARDVDQSK